MSTYLELVKDVARLTGTIEPRTVTTATGATGRIADVAFFVNEAWTEIQNMYRAWRFLVRDIPDSARLEVGVTAYTAASLGLPNWSAWIVGTGRRQIPLSVWEADGSRGQEQQLIFVVYDIFRLSYQFGSSVERTGRPRAVSIDQQERLVVWPKPEQAYRLAGTYRRAPQVFEADADVPIIAPEHHRAITRLAHVKVQEFEEADPNVIIAARQQAMSAIANLRRRYLTVNLGLDFNPVGPSGDDDRGETSIAHPVTTSQVG